MNGRPLHDWHRYHPTAHGIAAELLAHADILALRTRMIASDIQQRFEVAESTAMRAVGIARAAHDSRAPTHLDDAA